MERLRYAVKGMKLARQRMERDRVEDDLLNLSEETFQRQLPLLAKSKIRRVTAKHQSTESKT